MQTLICRGCGFSSLALTVHRSISGSQHPLARLYDSAEMLNPALRKRRRPTWKPRPDARMLDRQLCKPYLATAEIVCDAEDDKRDHNAGLKGQEARVCYEGVGI